MMVSVIEIGRSCREHLAIWIVIPLESLPPVRPFVKARFLQKYDCYRH